MKNWKAWGKTTPEGIVIPALLQKPLAGRAVQCRLCAHYCRIENGETGICRVRLNRDGILYSLNYDRVIAVHSDPIEKKPLYHFLPGSSAFSLAAMGCNFQCRFCQNYSISQVDPRRGPQGEPIPPRELVQSALDAGCRSLAYTYTEPTVFFELMLETAKLARARGLKNIMITNGFISAEGLDMLAPWIDAANVDLKAGSDAFYREQCGGRLQPVLKTITAMHQAGIWLEVTTLLIPGLNTDDAQLSRVVTFLHDLNPHIPWHVSRYYPQYQMDRPSTEAGVIEAALAKARDAGLVYLYAGNLPLEEWSDTRCPQCNALLIRRSGYAVTIHGLDKGKCRNCGCDIAGVYE
ncbi:MAG: AmmeMemoRadiSam system radical SAM enzyme [Acidobacteriota bacterium]|nr:AmmeMemoRadiSam system radical SAM enzyme [Acidobacteriota bacterium]